MKLIQIFSVVSLLQAVSVSATQKDDPNAQLSDVIIRNSTPYPATGRVTYREFLGSCKPDNFSLPPAPGRWSNGAGICLIRRIAGSLAADVPGCDRVTVDSYTSTSGTAFRQFNFVQTGPCSFRFGRLSDEEVESGQGLLRGSFVQEERVDSSSSEDVDDYMPDEETLEEIEEEELDVIMKAREAIAKIAHDGVAGDMDENTSDEESPSSLMMMEERKLSSCGTACQACKLACDVKFRVKEEACLLACRAVCLIGGKICNDCRAACRAPRATCNRACDLLP